MCLNKTLVLQQKIALSLLVREVKLLAPDTFTICSSHPNWDILQWAFQNKTGTEVRQQSSVCVLVTLLVKNLPILFRFFLFFVWLFVFNTTTCNKCFYLNLGIGYILVSRRLIFCSKFELQYFYCTDLLRIKLPQCYNQWNLIVDIGNVKTNSLLLMLFLVYI